MGLFSKIWWELDLTERARWALHNGFAHPMMIFLPRSMGMWLHDATIPMESEKEEAKIS